MLASIDVLVHISLSSWDSSKNGRESESMCIIWPHYREGHWFCVLAVDLLYVKSPTSGLEAHVRGWKRPPAPSMDGNHEIHPTGAPHALASFRSPTKGARGVLGKWKLPFRHYFRPQPFFFFFNFTLLKILNMRPLSLTNLKCTYYCWLRYSVVQQVSRAYASYWAGQKVRSGFSARCCGKTWMNFLAKPIFNWSFMSVD